MSIPRVSLSLLFALLVVGCESNESSDSTTVQDQSSTEPYTILFISESLSNGSIECAQGGAVIYSGFDSNGNAELDSSEITENYPVCNGDNAGSYLVDLTDGAPEAACPFNGKTIEFGLDLDGNGSLTADEIDNSKTEYLCNTYNSLIEVHPLEYGNADCSYGGDRITVGIDLNSNDAIDSDEPVSTSFICNEAMPLTLVKNEPASPETCFYGGTAVLNGNDLNGDGDLTEVDTFETTYFCNEPSALLRSLSCSIDVSSVAGADPNTYILNYRIDEFADFNITVTGEMETPALTFRYPATYGRYINNENWLTGNMEFIFDLFGQANRGSWSLTLERDTDGDGSIPFFIDAQTTTLTVSYTDSEIPDSDGDGDPDVLTNVFNMNVCSSVAFNY